MKYVNPLVVGSSPTPVTKLNAYAATLYDDGNAFAKVDLQRFETPNPLKPILNGRVRSTQEV